MLEAVTPTGAPSTAAVTLQITGRGFPAVATGWVGARCSFASAAAAALTTTPLVLTTPLTIESSTRGSCPSPAGGVVATYDFSILLNGVEHEPSANDEPQLTEYDPAAVRVTGALPPGGPYGVATEVMVLGANFDDYGDGQLQCLVGGVRSAGQLLSRSRVRCTVPPFALDAAAIEALESGGGHLAHEITISLNNASVGTVASGGAPFGVYAPPRLRSIAPKQGAATGGERVVIGGGGFMALCGNDAGACRATVRCKFGDEVQPAPPTHVDDTTVHCSSTYGPDGGSGVVVAVSLNGDDGDFSPSSGDSKPAPRFRFEGRHPPAVVEAFFPQEATSLLVRLDEQPTNRAGMSGLSDCSAVLDKATVAQLQGGETRLLCRWESDSLLAVQLGSKTGAAPGMRVGLRARVLWPRYWARAVDAPVACAALPAAESFCMGAAEDSI